MACGIGFFNNGNFDLLDSPIVDGEEPDRCGSVPVTTRWSANASPPPASVPASPCRGLSRKLRKPQSFISSYERGQRRVDIVEFLLIAEAIRAEARKLFREIYASRRGA
jgi:hypothetical protein